MEHLTRVVGNAPGLGMDLRPNETPIVGHELAERWICFKQTNVRFKYRFNNIGEKISTSVLFRM